MTIEIGPPPLWLLSPLLTLTVVLSTFLTLGLFARFFALWAGQAPGKGQFRTLLLLVAIVMAYVSVLLLSCDWQLHEYLRNPPPEPVVRRAPKLPPRMFHRRAQRTNPDRET